MCLRNRGDTHLYQAHGGGGWGRRVFRARLVLPQGPFGTLTATDRLPGNSSSKYMALTFRLTLSSTAFDRVRGHDQTTDSQECQVTLLY